MSERPADLDRRATRGQGATGGQGASADAPHDLPGERPPKRLLEQAPSARIATVSATTPGVDAGSAGRAVAYGACAALAGALAHLAAATLLLWTSELLVVAVTIGIVVGLAVAFGARGSLRSRTRRGLAVVLALGSIAVAAGIGWAISGMYLAPVDFLDQVYGLLVPLQLVLAAAGALAGSR